MIALEVNHLTVSLKHPARIILDDINLSIKEGEMIGLVGLSGAGKSVLAKTIAGIVPNLIPLDVTGSVQLFGEEVKSLNELERLETVGYIFQNADNQIISDTVQEELSFGPENLSYEMDYIEERVSTVLNDLNMKRYRHYNPDSLSGGEKYLLALGSILTIDPKIIICDELLCQLDDEGAMRVVNILKKLREEDKTIIVIEHDMKKLDFVDHIHHITEGKLNHKGVPESDTPAPPPTTIGGDNTGEDDIAKILGKSNDVAPPDGLKPNAVPDGLKPNAVPDALKPNAVPDALKPNAVPDALKPNAVPDALKPNAVPDALKPNAVPDALKSTAPPDALKSNAPPADIEKILGKK